MLSITVKHFLKYVNYSDCHFYNNNGDNNNNNNNYHMKHKTSNYGYEIVNNLKPFPVNKIVRMPLCLSNQGTRDEYPPPDP